MYTESSFLLPNDYANEEESESSSYINSQHFHNKKKMNVEFIYKLKDFVYIEDTEIRILQKHRYSIANSQFDMLCKSINKIDEHYEQPELNFY